MSSRLAALEAKYDVVSRLGGGGMGHIFLVRHRELDELRVVKLMRGDLATDEGLRQRFVREARTASQLRHPNIAHLYDFFTDESGHAFLVMEYIDGVTFETLVGRTPPVPVALVLAAAGQALAALGFLHRRDFVHRDIAPDNLMLTRDADGPLVKLIDLGIAKSLHSSANLTGTGGFVGKLRYASPEQIVGGLDGDAVGPASDLYSFGVVLYELLTGRFPLPGDSVASIVNAHFSEPPIGFAATDPQGRVPASLRAIILQCLQKRAEARPSSARELADRLQAAAAALPPEEDVAIALGRLLPAGGGSRGGVPGSPTADGWRTLRLVLADHLPAGPAAAAAAPMPPAEEPTHADRHPRPPAPEQQPPGAAAPREGEETRRTGAWKAGGVGPSAPTSQPAWPSQPSEPRLPPPAPSPPTPPSRPPGPPSPPAAHPPRSRAMVTEEAPTRPMRSGDPAAQAQAAAPRQPRWRAVFAFAAVAVAALLVGAVGWMLWVQSDDVGGAPTGPPVALAPGGQRAGASATLPPAGPVAMPTAAAHASLAPAAPASATLELLALPWAEVELVDEAGRSVPLPAGRLTPLTLALPAGNYTASLRHPRAAARRVVSLRLEPGQVHRETVDLGVMDADGYLAAIGWR